MAITTATVFDHRGRTKKNELGPLEIRVTVDRRPYYINTGIRIYRSEFKFSQIINRPDADELNSRLEILTKKVESAINHSLEQSIPIDVAAIRRNILSVADDKHSPFIEWCEQQLPLLNISEGTLRHFQTLIKRLKEYGHLRTWSDITVENILNLDAWLHTLTKPQSAAARAMGTPPTLISDAGVHNYHKNLRVLLYRADAIGLIHRSPYEQLKGKFSKGENDSTEYLTECEMQQLMSAPIPPGSMELLARDLFTFQMFTGLSYSDAINFSLSDYKLVDGRYITRQQRVKTGVAYVSQLLPPALEVIQKYGGKVPCIDNSTYNKLLKSVARYAGLSVNLHSHLARHTFATYMLRNGVAIENLSRMLGHTNITQTQRYAKVLAEAVHEEFSKIEEKLKKSSNIAANKNKLS